ncbi:patatin-like protein [Dongia sp.]|jgi:patatin-related protein|uniref:patatin-like protein n=1 Tax=Dongia sp. TaxID=1977262 RepID=UPI0035AF8D01
MKQIEVRLAVVLYGGVSLAVYIHGVTREILNLIRASKQLHAEAEGATAAVSDSTAVYLDLLKSLEPDIDLRIVIDLISGASAGGINGVMLARALAHDLPLDSHRELWLQNADVTQLSVPASLVSRTLKGALAPIIDKILIRRFGQQVADPETLAKVRRFVQARWFTPPFSGPRFAGWMLDACDNMDAGGGSGISLLPPGHRLDLFVTVTDYRGHRHRIALHDPPVVEETEHRRILAFSCRRTLSGELQSEFGPEHVPSLVFASRATACFPGAFVPATVAEMDDILAQRGRGWPARTALLVDKLGVEGDLDQAAANRFFIDGSVVMNKPFSPVISALGDRPASREVIRRIIYVDPNPRPDGRQRSGEGAPGFFRTILASLAVIPRNEPIADDLLGIEAWNVRARRMAEILAAADPEVERLVDDIVQPDAENPPTIAEVGRYRSAANEAAHKGAGYAYLSYQKLKLRGVCDRLSVLVAKLASTSEAAIAREVISDAFDRWLEHDDAPPARTIRFLRGFDIEFRLRRIRFVIRRLNELYRSAGETGVDVGSAAIDDLKGALYEAIERAAPRWDPAKYSGAPVAAAKRLAAAAQAGRDFDSVDLAALEEAFGLIPIDNSLDEIISVMGFAFLPPIARRAVAKAYVGFAFFDLITFPILQWTDMDEINEVLVDRISPDDAHGLTSGIVLRGTSLMSFGAFFNRSWREHDFLWGRLNAAERCLDVIVSAIGNRAAAKLDTNRLRGRLFLAILDSEEAHLNADPTLIPRLRREVMARYGFE